MDKDEAIKRISAGLRNRTGRAWSVTEGAKGWILIQAPPERRLNAKGKIDPKGKHLSDEDQTLLIAALGSDLVPAGSPIRISGFAIPPTTDRRREYVDRAESRTTQRDKGE